MPTRIGIALFHVPEMHGEPGYFHWALAATDQPTWDKQPIMVLEIKVLDGQYVHSLRTEDVVKTTGFLGIIDLLATDAYTVTSLRDTVRNRVPAHDKGWRVRDAAGRVSEFGNPVNGWTSSTWVLRGLDILREEGVWRTRRRPEDVYLDVVEKGHRILEGKPHQAVSSEVLVEKFE
ncbi:hypothetical protein BD626DRAFT_540621 [Schizophyllum amplum]|uniref:Uncharacterized protein n=1 Tax=Schizophyllum amplum TaxID=97359 RepID=A0A550BY22_9AGAR|nr:hypothetical protein BD626DRAFT_540621 [Auriculariopsis ampla]